MVVDISFENSANERTYFIFSAVHISPSLDAISVSVILWIMWKAKVVWTASTVTVKLSTHSTCMKQTENNDKHSLKPHCKLVMLICLIISDLQQQQQQQHFISPHNIQEIQIYNNSIDDDRGASLYITVQLHARPFHGVKVHQLGM